MYLIIIFLYWQKNDLIMMGYMTHKICISQRGTKKCNFFFWGGDDFLKFLSCRKNMHEQKH